MTESIGRCGWCGMVDHHLEDETCPQCRLRVVTLPDGNRRPRLDDYGEIPLGIGATDPARLRETRP